MIYVLAVTTAKLGMRDAVLTAFRANMRAVHAETGCIEYEPVTDAEGFDRFATAFGPDAFVSIEKWDSPDALKAHASSSHVAAYAATTKEMIASRVIHVLSAG